MKNPKLLSAINEAEAAVARMNGIAADILQAEGFKRPDCAFAIRCQLTTEASTALCAHVSDGPIPFARNRN
jgi:hypothetical protein